MSSFLAVSVSTERSQHTADRPRKQTVCSKVVNRDRNDEPAFYGSPAGRRLHAATRSLSRALPATYPHALNSSHAGARVSGTSATIRAGREWRASTRAT